MSEGTMPPSCEDVVFLARQEYNDLIGRATLLELVLASADVHGFADRSIIATIQAMTKGGGSDA